jgi:hypothetical protein
LRAQPYRNMAGTGGASLGTQELPAALEFQASQRLEPKPEKPPPPAAGTKTVFSPRTAGSQSSPARTTAGTKNWLHCIALKLMSNPNQIGAVPEAERQTSLKAWYRHRGWEITASRSKTLRRRRHKGQSPGPVVIGADQLSGFHSGVAGSPQPVGIAISHGLCAR